MAEIAKTGIQTLGAEADISALAGVAIASSIRIPGRGTTAERDAAWPNPTNADEGIAQQGAEWVNTETGTTDRYYWDWNASSNPGGARSGAGWKPAKSALIDIPQSQYMSGFLRDTGNPLQYQRLNEVVQLTGVVNRNPQDKTGVIFTLPLGFRPIARFSGLAHASGVVRAEFIIDPSTGNVSTQFGTSNSPGLVLHAVFLSNI